MALKAKYQNICPMAKGDIELQGNLVTKGQISWYSHLRRHVTYVI